MFRFLSTPDHMSRREALKLSGCGFGYLAFLGLTAKAREPQSPLAAKEPHFPARAKRVIFMYMNGGPSHVDTFDYKPKLAADDGRSVPISRDRRIPVRLLGSPWSFNRHGRGGMWMSSLFPNLGRQADEICMLNGMHTNVPAHAQATLQLHTGTSQFVRPSLGAWTLYGLGTVNDNLPGFVSINPPAGQGGAQNYASAFLPAIYQGTPVGRGGFGGEMTVSNVRNPRLTNASQRAQLDLIQELNREKLARDEENARVDGVIQSYELGFRMQRDLPEVLDLSRERRETLAMYGIGSGGGGGGFGGFGGGGGGTDNFGRQCLTARRLVEAGVRFVEISSGNWDQHQNLRTALDDRATAIDKPIAALIADLKSRGMLDDTLIVWSGEFGRTPYAQGTDGRDHNHRGFSAFFAGGGVKGGFTYGKTDDYGYEAVEGRMHTHDFHATILHLMGLNHERLTFRYAGRDFRLTDVHGQVPDAILR